MTIADMVAGRLGGLRADMSEVGVAPSRAGLLPSTVAALAIG